MRIRFFHILILVLSADFAIAQMQNRNMQNPNVQNSGRARDPISSYQPSVTPAAPQDYYISGNDVVTGNVSGGKEFRGTVPYSSPTDFEGTTAGSSFDPFLRYSSPANYSYGPYQPYYSPTRTVTTQQVGIGVTRPPSNPPTPIPNIYMQSADAKRLELIKRNNIPNEMTTPNELIIPNEILFPQIAPTLTPAQQNIEKELLSQEQKRFSGFMDLTAAQRQEQIEKLTKEIGLIPTPNEEKNVPLRPEKIAPVDQQTAFQTANLEKTEKKPLQPNELPQTPPLNEKIKENPYNGTVPQPFEKEKPQQQTNVTQKEKPQEQKPVDVFQQLQKDIESSQQQIQPTQPAVQPGKEPAKPDQLDKIEKLIQKHTQVPTPQPQAAQPAIPGTQPAIPGQTPVTKDQTAPTSPLEKMPTGTELAAQAKSILGEHKNFSSYAEDRYNTHLLLGNKLIEEGHFYRAIDAYTMALVYKPDNVLAMAGKGHALFAAGEYMTAAMFISKAIELNPQYINANITVNDMTSNRDTLDTRMAEIDQLQQKVDVPELDFLQAYFNYRVGSLGPAKEKIDKVLQKKPDFKAAEILKNAIEQAANNPNK